MNSRTGTNSRKVSSNRQSKLCCLRNSRQNIKGLLMGIDIPQTYSKDGFPLTVEVVDGLTQLL